MKQAAPNIDQAEIGKFDQLASRWWDPDSEFKPLHDINPLRLDYIHATRYRSETRGGELHWIQYPRESLANQTILLVDDILDAEGDAEKIGKDVGQDANKATYVTVHGVEATRRAAREHLEAARAALGELDGDTAVLDTVAAYCLERSH